MQQFSRRAWKITKVQNDCESKSEEDLSHMISYFFQLILSLIFSKLFKETFLKVALL